MGDEKEKEKKERIEKGRTFLTTYTPPSEHVQAIYTLNANIGKCRRTLERRKTNGDKADLIEQAEQDLSNAEVEKDIEKCNVALKYGGISAEQELSLRDYLVHLKALLVPVGGK